MSSNILYFEINIFCVAILALIIWKSSGSMRMISHNAFVRALVAVVSFILSDMFAYLMLEGTLPFYAGVLLLLKSIYFMSTTLMCSFWFFYYECLGDSELGKNEKKYLWVYGLVFLQAFLTILNLKYGFFFYLDEANDYYRGKLFVMQYVIAYFYAFMACVRTVRRALTNSNYVDRDKMVSLLAFVLLPALAGLIQYFQPKLPVACCAMTFASLIMYFDAMRDQIAVDPLTKLSNRKELMWNISRRMKNDKEQGVFYLFMIDANYFKSINDTYGHVEGDEALKRIADAMRFAAGKCRNKLMTARFGGDEFTMVGDMESEEEAKLLVQNLKENLVLRNKEANAPYPLTVSVGMAKFAEEIKTVRQFIAVADDQLYEQKKNRR